MDWEKNSTVSREIIIHFCNLKKMAMGSFSFFLFLLLALTLTTVQQHLAAERSHFMFYQNHIIVFMTCVFAICASSALIF